MPPRRNETSTGSREEGGARGKHGFPVKRAKRSVTERSYGVVRSHAARSANTPSRIPVRPAPRRSSRARQAKRVGAAGVHVDVGQVGCRSPRDRRRSPACAFAGRASRAARGVESAVRRGSARIETAVRDAVERRPDLLVRGRDCALLRQRAVGELAADGHRRARLQRGETHGVRARVRQARSPSLPGCLRRDRRARGSRRCGAGASRRRRLRRPRDGADWRGSRPSRTVRPTRRRPVCRT